MARRNVHAGEIPSRTNTKPEAGWEQDWERRSSRFPVYAECDGAHVSKNKSELGFRKCPASTGDVVFIWFFRGPVEERSRLMHKHARLRACAHRAHM